MRILLKVFNPLIWLYNFMNYMGHMESYRGREYKPYDFSKDKEYF